MTVVGDGLGGRVTVVIVVDSLFEVVVSEFEVVDS